MIWLIVQTRGLLNKDMTENLLEKVVSLCKRRGFIFPGSEIYGGLKGTWDYGPLGAELKFNLKEAWWDYMVKQRENVFGVNASILMNPKVWEASGHVESFTDPLIECKTCNERFRADKPADIKEHENVHIKKKEKVSWTEPKQFNILVEAKLGVVEGEKTTVYLRGEITQGVHVNFKNVVDSMHPKIPFGVAQVGKAFRNEITPRNFIFRSREFEQMEMQTYVKPDEKEAMDMVLKALDWYRQLYEDYYAIPVLLGTKSTTEKFAGAKITTTLEALMPDGKALQGGTSHNLGQNFSKVFDIKFQSREGKMEFGWQTSWGLSTRSLGSLFMVHGDDSGLILPPKIAPIQTVIMPILKKDSAKTKELLVYCGEMKEALDNGGVRSKFDSRDEPSVGRRFNEWEVKGVPLRFEVGEKELADRSVTLARRDTGEKITVKREEMLTTTEKLLKDIQVLLFAKAKKFLTENTRDASSFEEFKEIMSSTRGFIRAFWCEDAACEAKIKEETKATTRCLPLDAAEEKGMCVYCGKEATHRWIFAQAY